MSLNNLKPAEGSNKKAGKIIGRGQGSGKGGTATRGHKGAKSRSGYSKKIGFEGGQMPLQRRVPKFGFTNRNRTEYQGINLATIQSYLEANRLEKDFGFEDLVNVGLVGKNDLVKILGNGEIKEAVNVTAHKFSASAAEAIKAAGGSVTTI
ncbi:50S ribosomal protein L15 [Nonlabens spongiae]|uniref:Large ribosomal subunit protein uL15 n=1 Tax=Nonlabens spongiae TaxID=331648 RepID=A0A1W6MK79_9FLAO|nr:50S ribosomal protein L15 [Nonlabens spongiae]ARN77972.1 50S ribosomal protein L15 [Nonlabens spongiae]